MAKADVDVMLNQAASTLFPKSLLGTVCGNELREFHFGLRLLESKEPRMCSKFDSSVVQWLNEKS
jgi:hypothetical protein